jgi:ribonuclease HII
MPSFALEKPHPQPLAGVDEAGRGPLAGPVVAAAVILHRTRFPRGIDDSKKVDAATRETLYGRIRASAAVGVGIASVEEIDCINIFQATMLAMTRAVDALGLEPAMVLVDGNICPKWRYTSKPIVSGDALCRSIAAASIIAKVTRDRIMAAHHEAHPGYNWRQNKGYATPDHCRALAELGPSPLHRRSFSRVAQMTLALEAAE